MSNPHPHAQIYATNFVFRTIEVEAQAAAEHMAEHGRVLFRDVIDAEEEDGRRLVVQHGSALSFVPYFARYPYETYIAPRETHASLAELSGGELVDLAEVLRRTLVRMDNLWRMSFPYVMVLHQAPTDGATLSGIPLPHPDPSAAAEAGAAQVPRRGRRSAAGNFLNDTAPEDKAAELRAVSETHYRTGSPGSDAGRHDADARRLLPTILALHDRIRTSVVDAFVAQGRESMSDVAGDDDAGDTIYAVDRVSEETLVAGLEEVARDEPLVLVAEGLPRGRARAAARRARSATASGDCSSIRSTARAG